MLLLEFKMVPPRALNPETTLQNISSTHKHFIESMQKYMLHLSYMLKRSFFFATPVSFSQSLILPSYSSCPFSILENCLLNLCLLSLTPTGAVFPGDRFCPFSSLANCLFNLYHCGLKVSNRSDVDLSIQFSLNNLTWAALKLPHKISGI